LIEEVKNPQKYGVIKGYEVERDIFKITGVVEKPKKPPSKLAIIALYILKPIIYKAIENTAPDENGEIQLTDALQLLINWKCNVYGVKLLDNEMRIDIGTAENYLKTLRRHKLRIN
jgi:UTP--glucose-1-phosphate uridylyltransferase